MDSLTLRGSELLSSPWPHDRRQEFDLEFVGTEPHTAEDRGQQGPSSWCQRLSNRELRRLVGDYVGDSTRAEIAYARSLGKPVRFTHPGVDPDA